MNEIQQRQNIARGIADSSRYSGGGDDDSGTLGMVFLVLIGSLIYYGLFK
jgi:hypothetical protein